MSPRIRFAILLLTARLIAGQSGVTIIAAGYVDPSFLQIAPGQVTTLFLRDVKSVVPRQAASTLPLPMTLAGLSVSLRQFSNAAPIPVPILAVGQLQNGCPGALSNTLVADPCRITTVTIQVPMNLSIPRPASTPNPNRRQELVVSENGISGTAFSYGLLNDNIHVVNTCGLIQPGLFADCRSVVTHVDGTLVEATRPAQPGETLVLYALGLGATEQIVPAGSESPSPPANLAYPLNLAFEFNPNAAVERPGPPSATVIFDQPVFAGLAPHYAGLYQVNVKVPAVPTGTPACLTGSPSVQSNVTITLLGLDTFDGARFCVQTSFSGDSAR